MAFAMFFFLFSCKTKKHLQLEATTSKSNFHIDSNYIDSINSKITSFKTTTINFNVLGKPTSVIIKESVVESKNELKKGDLIKDISKDEETIKKDKVVDRDGSKFFSINYWGVIPALLIIALILFLHKKK